MVAVIRGLLARRDDIAIRLFPVSLDQDRAAIDDILERGDFPSDGRVEAIEPESIDDLLAGLQGVSVVVATRLHQAQQGLTHPPSQRESWLV